MATMPTLSAKDLRSQKIRDLYQIATSAKKSAANARKKASELAQEAPVQAAAGSLGGAFLSPVPDMFLPSLGPVYPSTIAGVGLAFLGAQQGSTMIAAAGAGMAGAQARELGARTFASISAAIFGK